MIDIKNLGLNYDIINTFENITISGIFYVYSDSLEFNGTLKNTESDNLGNIHYKEFDKKVDKSFTNIPEEFIENIDKYLTETVKEFKEQTKNN